MAELVVRTVTAEDRAIRPDGERLEELE